MLAVARKQLPLRPAGPDTVAALLDWYDREGRVLPWRISGRYSGRDTGKRRADTYKVWLSEIMLQQTTVKAVIPYFEKFIARWPKVAALAAADQEEVLAQWAGLGYYSRARNLHACAKLVVSQYGGKFPKTSAELRTLPGIGPYTAAAIAAIAYNEKATPVDGNIERVTARLFAISQPLPGAKKDIARLAATLTPSQRPGDFAQALMDLGATVCTPRRPSCLVCPVQSDCHANAKGIEEQLPKRDAKAERPVRYGAAFLAVREDGHVLLRKRLEKGLLGGMLEIPSTAWIDEVQPARLSLSSAPVRADWWPVPGIVVHTFTHFRLEMTVYRAIVPASADLTFWADPDRCRWLPRNDLDGAALPSVMRKLIAHGMKGS